jgi:large subunit ribosomal protein L4|tara:strand:+ start:906 stop:1529 length:624 start_codon:yes stop_codon:yes gene_type:complete
MKKQVVNLNNKPINEIDLPDFVFNIKVLPHLIHQYIRYQNAKKRQGSHKTKTRSEVKGKAKKPFAQKGTGNARQGSSKAPHFRGGAISMGPQNQDHSFSLNKKEKKLALKCALSEKNQKNEIIIIDDLKLSSYKTKELALILKNFNFNSALFVYDPYKLDQNFKRASSNLPKVNLLSQSGINVKDLIHHEKIFIVKDSIDVISKRLL